MDEARLSMSRRRLIGGAAGAATLALTAGTIGCGGDDDAATSTATAAGAAAGGATTAPSAASPATKNIPAEFVIANEAEPDDMLPYFGGFGPGMVMRSLYESLFEVRMSLKPDGSADVAYKPMLAQSFEQLDATTFRFKLRSGVLFHDGEGWDAAAAKASFDALVNPDTAKALKKQPLLASGLKEMRIVDPMTVDVVSSTPSNFNEMGIWVRLGFSGVSPKALKDKGLAGMLESEAGTGPFTLKSWTRGGELKLDGFAKYWAKDATNIPALKFITRKEASVRAQTIKSGEAHLAFNIGSEQGAALAKQLVAGGFQSSSLRLNNSIAPTNDKRVRQAINYAIDRDSINKSIFKGTAQPIGFFAFQPVKVDPFPYKPDEAARLINEAGVKGKELELVYGEGRIPEEDQLTEIYKSELEAVGLKVKLTKLEPRQYNELGGKPFPEQPPLYMETTSSGNYGEIAGGLRDKYGCNGSGTFCSPAFDAEYAKLATLTGADRQTLLQSIATRLQTEETPRAWVIGVRQVHGVAANVGSNAPLNAYLIPADLFFA